MKNLIIIGILVGIWLVPARPVLAVDYYSNLVAGIKVKVVDIDLSNPKILVTPLVSAGFPSNPESFSSLIQRTQPVAAINGTFFCTQTFEPIGDIVINRELVYFGGLGTALAITKKNQVEFIKVEKWRHMDWSRYASVISSGPRLIEDGKIVVDPYAEGFKDPRLFGEKNRSAVGVTFDNRLLFVTTTDGVSFKKLAEVMKYLDCKDALNLDGGSSSALYYRGEIITRPKTLLTNILAVYEVESVSAKFLSQSQDAEFDIFKLLVFTKAGGTYSLKTYKEGKSLAELNLGEFPKFEASQLQLFSSIIIESSAEGAVIKSAKDHKTLVILQQRGEGSAKFLFPLLKIN